MLCDSGVIHFQRRAHTDHRFSPQRAREWIPQGLLVSVPQRTYAATPLARVTCVHAVAPAPSTLCCLLLLARCRAEILCESRDMALDYLTCKKCQTGYYGLGTSLSTATLFP